MNLRRAAVRYVKSVYATIAPLPDPPEMATTVKKQRINWLSLGSAVRVGTRTYLQSWKTLLRRESQPKATNAGPETGATGKRGETMADSTEPLLTKDDRQEMMAAGGRLLSNLRDGLIEFLRGYREGKAEEETKGPIKF